MTSFQDVKQQLATSLETIGSHILFPQERLDAMKRVGSADAISHLENYNKQILKARSLLVQLNALDKFGWFLNSQRVWLASVVKCAELRKFYIDQFCSFLATQDMFSRMMISQMGITKFTPVIFMIQKKGSQYTATNANETQVLTYEQVCGLLPNPGQMMGMKLEAKLDPSDIVSLNLPVETNVINVSIS